MRMRTMSIVRFWWRGSRLDVTSGRILDVENFCSTFAKAMKRPVCPKVSVPGLPGNAVLDHRENVLRSAMRNVILATEKASHVFFSHSELCG